MHGWMADDWLQSLLGQAPELAPDGVRSADADARIATLDDESLAERDAARLPYARAVKAGLHLWNGSLDASHAIAQDIENATGSFWHGIMHRMEGDYSNAKYWFRLVVAHPIYELLYAGLMRLDSRSGRGQGASASPAAAGWQRLVAARSWEPYLFVDLIEMQVCGRGDADTGALLRSVQQLEMKLLLQYSYHECCGGTFFDAID